jgi:leucine-zipper of insertion element IS481
MARGVSPAPVRKWLRRHESEGVAGLQDRTSRPHRLRTRITSHRIAQVEALRRARQPFWKIVREAGLSLGPVARIAKAKGLSRLSALDPRIEIIRYEKKQPGEMIHIDIKKLGRQGAGHRITGDRTGQSAPRRRKEGGKDFRISPEYRHLGVDDHSRLAYSEILPDETWRSCLKFLLQALRFYRDHGVKVLRGMTGNGVSFRSLSARKGVAPYTPRTTGKAERFVPTSLPEWAKPAKGSSRRSLVGMAGGGLCQTLQPFIRTGRRTVAFPPPLQSSSASLRHQRMPPLSQGSPSITYRDTTASVGQALWHAKRHVPRLRAAFFAGKAPRCPSASYAARCGSGLKEAGSGARRSRREGGLPL